MLTLEVVTSPSPSAYHPSMRVSPTTLRSTEHVTTKATAVHIVVGVQATIERHLVTLVQLLRAKGSNPRFFFLSDCRTLPRAPGFAALATSVEAHRQNTRDFTKITVLTIRQNLTHVQCLFNPLTDKTAYLQPQESKNLTLPGYS